MNKYQTLAANTALFIGLNILFLVVFQWGNPGYVLSTTVANLMTTVLLVWKERLWRYIPMLALSMAAAAFSNFMGSVYVVTKKSSASFWTSLIGALVNIGLNLWLIPKIGIQGAAAATFASCLAVFLIRTVSARRFCPFPSLAES